MTAVDICNTDLNMDLTKSLVVFKKNPIEIVKKGK